MENDIDPVEHVRGFFVLHKQWLEKQLIIIFSSLILGASCGFAMILFNYLLIIFKFGFSYLPYFLSPIIAGLSTSLLVKYGNSDKLMGTGASEFVKDSNLSDFELIVHSHIWKRRIKNTFTKTIATSWTYGSGMICGLEGPGLFIGSNLGFLIAKSAKLDVDMKDAFFIGASACTGAILKSPVSGALFCAELPYYNHIRYKSLIPSIIASSIAYYIFGLFFGFEPLIHTNLMNQSYLYLNILRLLPFLIIFGIFSGLFVLIFMGLLRAVMNNLNLYFSKRKSRWATPLLGSIGYGILLFFILPFLEDHFINLMIYSDADFITSLLNMIEVISNNWIIYLILLIIFTLTIFLSIGTYNSAGIISPLLILGALVGGLFGALFYPEYTELFILLGMSAVLGATINNPITAIFIIIEMTWTPILLIPAGITTIIAYIFSGPSGIISDQEFISFNSEM